MSDSANTATAAANKEQLAELLMDVFLLEDDEFSFEMRREDIETWDSLGVVALAVGVHETFGYHCTPEEATQLASVQDIMTLLTSKGIAF